MPGSFDIQSQWGLSLNSFLNGKKTHTWKKNSYMEKSLSILLLLL